MKLITIFLLILLLLVAGLPLTTAHVDMDPCPACAGDDIATAWGLCLAFLTGLALVLPALRHRVSVRDAAVPFLLLVRLPHRPPRPR